MITISANNSYGYIPYSTDVHAIVNQYLRLRFVKKVTDPLKSRRKHPVFMKVLEYVEMYDIVDNMCIRIPRGLLSFLPRSQFEIIESPHNVITPEVDFNDIKTCLSKEYVLRDDQVEATIYGLYSRRGILQLPTGSGKTIIMAAIVKLLCNANPDKKFVVVAPSNVIIRHIISTFQSVGINCAWYDKNTDNEAQVIVSHVLSLSKDYSVDFVKSINGIFFDEAQHVDSESYSKVINNFEDCEYSLGFSALVVDNDHAYSENIKDYSESELRIIGLTGQVLISRTGSEYIEQGILATPVLFMINNTHTISDQKNDWHYLVSKYIMADYRNKLIADVVDMFHRYNRRVLILVSTKKHAEDIANTIVWNYGYSDQVGLSFGGSSGKKFSSLRPCEGTKSGVIADLISKDSREVLKEFEDGNISILLGTTHLDEGADISNLDVCILAGGGKNPRRIIQRVGRALRKSKSGKYAYVVDFLDSNVGILNYQSKQRISVYINEVGIPNNLRFESINLEYLEKQFLTLENLNG